MNLFLQEEVPDVRSRQIGSGLAPNVSPIVSPVTVQHVSTVTGLRALFPAWTQLLRQSPSWSVFLTPEWINAWLETICPDAELYVLVARDARDQLVGIAPFHRHPLRFGKMLRLRCLSVLGLDKLSGGEYPVLIARPDAANAIITAFAQYLRTHAADWDCAWLPNVADWNGTQREFAQLAHEANATTRSRSGIFSAIPLPDDYEAYEKSLSKNARHHLRRCTKKLMAGPGLELVLCDSMNSLRPMIETHMRFNEARWRDAGQGGTFRFPERVAFYHRLAEHALATGLLGFFGLRVAGELRALWFGFICGQTYYSLSLSYDVEFEQQNRTGAANVLYGQMLPVLLQRGVREFDHLGGTSDYKARWGALPRHGSNLLICRKSLKGSLLHYSGVWPGGRYASMETPGFLAHFDSTENAPAAAADTET